MRLPELKQLAVNRLCIDPVLVPYQRMPEKRKAKLRALARKFDMRKVGTFKVSARPDGVYAVMDGGGRLYIMTVLLPQHHDELVNCEVHHGLSLQDEAAIYSSQQDQTPLRPIDFHRSQVVEGDPDAVALDETMKSYDLQVGARWPHGISSVATVQTLHDLGVLRRVLPIALNVWSKEIVRGPVFIALGGIYAAYGYDLDERRLLKVMQTNPAEKVYHQVKAETGGVMLHPHVLPRLLARAIMRAYNGRLSSENRLDLERLDAVLSAVGNISRRHAIDPGKGESGSGGDSGAPASPMPLAASKTP